MTESENADVLQELARLPTIAHPTASPAGEEIVFYYNETGRNESYVLDIKTGEREQWSDGKVPRNAQWFIRWDSDGERVFFHRDEEGDEQNDIYAIDRAGEVDPVIRSAGQNVLQDIGPDGESLLVGSSREGQMNCYRHDLAEDRTTKLTDYEPAAMAGTLSPDGERLLVADNTEDRMRCGVYDLESESIRWLGDRTHEKAPAAFTEDGTRVLGT